MSERYSIFTKARIFELAKQGMNVPSIYKQLITEECEGSFTMAGIDRMLRKKNKKEE